MPARHMDRYRNFVARRLVFNSGTFIWPECAPFYGASTFNNSGTFNVAAGASKRRLAGGSVLNNSGTVGSERNSNSTAAVQYRHFQRPRGGALNLNGATVSQRSRHGTGATSSIREP